MKQRIAISLAGIATVVMIAGTFAVASRAQAEPVFQEQEPALKTMWVVARGSVIVLRLYDKPDPLGKTMVTIPAGQPIEVFTDEIHNKHWFKTKDGHYAHSYYLTDVDPAYDPEAERAAMSSEEMARENELLDKGYSISDIALILSNEIKIGFTMEMVMDAWGNPDDTLIKSTAMGRDEFTWTYYSPPGGRKRTVLSFDYRKVVYQIATDK